MCRRSWATARTMTDAAPGDHLPREARGSNAGATLEMRGIVKRYGATIALAGVDFTARAGEVHALLGQNGSGKSTLMKIAYGEVRADAGEVRIGGESRRFRSPREAIAAGVAAVAQELPLASPLTVTENVLAGRLPTRRGRIRWAEAYESTASLLADLGSGINPRTLVRDLAPNDRQLIAIAHALSVGARILIFDEPTSSLSIAHVHRLFEVMRRLKEQGLAVVFITQRLAEIPLAGDTVTVLRDGHVVASERAADLSSRELATLVAGQTVHAHAPRPRVEEAPLLAVAGLTVGSTLRDVTFGVRKGEIVGVSGLVGCGRSELFRTLFGVLRPLVGTISVLGQRVDVRSPSHAVHLGIALVTGDRTNEGLAPHLSVQDNLLMVRRRRLSLRMINRRSERSLAIALVSDLHVRAAALNAPITSLSGGNQQKVVLGKWLAEKPRLLLLDEPTRGVDIAAKAEFHAVVERLAAEEGVGVLIGSLDDQELIETCHRILVMHRGKIVAEVDAASATERQLLALASGVEETEW